MRIEIAALLDIITDIDEMATKDDALLLALIDADLLEPINDVIMRTGKRDINERLGVH